jgi:glycosyltransferase involved in cell wall biosynthesis
MRQHSTLKNSKRVICSFYASATSGSEYRSGKEFIQFAAKKRFDLAIISDVENNSKIEELEAICPGIRIIRIPSLIKKQNMLYKFTDFIPTVIWNLRVARWLKHHVDSLEILWINNGFQPWHPFVNYFNLSKTIIWGPIGGGDHAPTAMMPHLSLALRIQEHLKAFIYHIGLTSKISYIRRHDEIKKCIMLARTSDSQKAFSSALGQTVFMIPEILNPLGLINLHRIKSSNPKLIWVGQDIPRKNLQLAINIFKWLRKRSFPGATLDIFGCVENKACVSPGIIFHGWVSKVPWENFLNDGVLLITSYREGLPSAVLEAVRNGLACVSTDVGSISILEIPTLHILPKTEYPNYSEQTLSNIENFIRQHIQRTEIYIEPVSYVQKLENYLTSQGIV